MRYAHESTMVGGDSRDDTHSEEWEGEMEGNSDQLFVVSSYTNFDKLAHNPRGTEASHSIRVFRFHPKDGSLVLLSIDGDPRDVMNPAFSRYHPSLNVVYTCTEDIQENGKIVAYSIASNGALTEIGQVDAGGTSTCYLTIDKREENIIATNYWDSTLTVIPINPDTGEFVGPIKNIYDPKGGKKMIAVAKSVNHTLNDETSIKMRQVDPHSHSLVLDPYVGMVAYVPDLGKDVIRELFYNPTTGSFDLEINVQPSGLRNGRADGPRYFEFHPKYNIAYVINECSCMVSVFAVDRGLIHEIAIAVNNKESMDQFKGRTTLRLIQSISTLPSAFPKALNVCGRICVHKSGRFVLVSNRGHESIAIFRVKKQDHTVGKLQAVGYFHTRGETPRHFDFDASGQFLIVANQDTSTISVFSFNLSSGEIKHTGNEYGVPSPNFVCCCPTREDCMLLLEGNDSEQSGTEVHIDLDADSDEGSTTACDTGKQMLYVELAVARKEIEDLKQKVADMASVA